MSPLRTLAALRLHGVLVVVAITFLAIAGFRSSEIRGNLVSQRSEPVADIALEHEEPLSITVEVSTRGKSGIVVLSSTSELSVYASVPEEWKRKEVRNASLSEVLGEPPMLGYRRWHIPPLSTVTFATTEAPTNIFIHNASESSVRVTGTHVDLETEEVLREVKLIEKAGMIW